MPSSITNYDPICTNEIVCCITKVEGGYKATLKCRTIDGARAVLECLNNDLSRVQKMQKSLAKWWPLFIAKERGWKDAFGDSIVPNSSI